jgi:CHAT domain-containing protein
VRSHSKHLSLITATLLLSLTSSLQLAGTALSISDSIAVKSTQASKVEIEKLSIKSFPRVNGKQFQVAGVAPAFKTEPSPTELRKELETLQQTLMTQRKNSDRAGEADTLNKMGEIHVQLKEYDNALNLHKEALAIYEELRDRQGEAESLGYVGNAYFQAGQYQKVEELFRQKLESLRKNGDRDSEQIVHEVMRRYLQTEWRLQAGYLAHQTKVKRFKAGELSWQEILEIAKLNLSINRELGNYYYEAIDLHSMGWAYRNFGNYQLALEFYQQALVLFRELGGRYSEAFLLIEIGLVYSDLAQYDLASQSIQQSLAILDSIQQTSIPIESTYDLEAADIKHFALNQMGWVYKQQRQYEKALSFLQQALSATLSPQGGYIWDKHNILNNIGAVYFEIGDYSKALESYQEALKVSNVLGDPGAPGFILNNIGLIHAQMESYTQALEAYRKALGLFRELDERPGQRNTLSNIGTLLEKQNKPELAIVFYKEAVNITESIRQDLQKLTIEEQKTYTETVASTYRRLADLLLSQGRILEAQQVLELLKVQELRNFTKDTRAGGEETVGIATNASEAEILKIHGTLISLGRKIEECQQCAERGKLLDQREAIAKEFEQTVRSLEQEIRDRTAKDDTFVDPRKLGGNAEAIVSEPGTVLIYPLVLENKIWILWASKGGITKSIEVPQVGLKQLSEKVVQFRQLLQNPNSDIAELKATGKQLYDWLLPQSLQKELKDNKIQNLVFSLDRVTRYIPISAVFDGENYLIENYNISTIISANLTQTGERLPPGTQNTSVLAAGLSEAKKGFNPLPNVPAELDAIVRQSSSDSQGIYPGLQLLNQSFNRQALRDNLASHLILHIATHGKFVPNNAYASYLLLGDGQELPIPEIQKLRDLNKIHLVVLSACETALGETGQDGTEITGLSYYFLEKGAKAVMASLWQVNDESTRLLMEQFYNNLAKSTAQSPITKAQALRQAQLSLIRSDRPQEGTLGNRNSINNTDSRSLTAQPRQGTSVPTSKALRLSHPYYWAPFILIGNGL